MNWMLGGISLPIQWKEAFRGVPVEMTAWVRRSIFGVHP